MRWPAHAIATSIATLSALPRLALPLAAASCDICPNDGSPVVLDRETVLRSPTIVVDGEACDPKSVTCIHRDEADRCDTFWIAATQEGACVFSVQFGDGSRIENRITYEADDTWPCEGHLQPPGDPVTRVYSKS